ncbi:MAG: PIN domain-containing protein [Hyphomonadaceae bacterium]|nr:PIN domain-containing protein [Clostridia bacterium]
MKKLKIYIETSVVSHLQADDVPEKMEITLKFWEDLKKGLYDIVLSEAVIIELSKCYEPKRNLLREFLDQINYDIIEIDDEADNLATRYINEGVVPSKCYEDALHIALASISGCKVILSWNFKHIVRVKTVLGANGINKLEGYGEIEIASPESMLEEGD